MGLIEQVVQNKYKFNANSYQVTNDGYKPENDSVFTELDALIRSKVALNKLYKPKTKINYNMVKQIQLLLERLKYIPNSGNYWMEKY